MDCSTLVQQTEMTIDGIFIICRRVYMKSYKRITPSLPGLSFQSVGLHSSNSEPAGSKLLSTNSWMSALVGRSLVLGTHSAISFTVNVYRCGVVAWGVVSLPGHHLVEVLHGDVGGELQFHIHEGLGVLIEARHLDRVQQRSVAVNHTRQKSLISI